PCSPSIDRELYARQHAFVFSRVTSTDRKCSELTTAALPTDPMEYFKSWLQHAVAEGVAEPHAMTLATADKQGGQGDIGRLGYRFQEWSFRSMSRFLSACRPMRRRISANLMMASVMNGPLLSITLSAPCALAASVISARDGWPDFARLSS